MAKKYVYETVIDVLSETRTVLSCPLDHKYDYLCKDQNHVYKHVGVKILNSGVELYFDDKFGLTIQADSVLSDPKHLRTLVYIMSTMP